MKWCSGAWEWGGRQEAKYKGIAQAERGMLPVHACLYVSCMWDIHVRFQVLYSDTRAIQIPSNFDVTTHLSTPDISHSYFYNLNYLLTGTASVAFSVDRGTTTNTMTCKDFPSATTRRRKQDYNEPWACEKTTMNNYLRPHPCRALAPRIQHSTAISASCFSSSSGELGTEEGLQTQMIYNRQFTLNSIFTSHTWKLSRLPENPAR